MDQPIPSGRGEDPPRAPAGFTRSEATYAVFAALFAVILVLTNIVGTKLFLLFPNGGPAWFNGGEPVTLTAGIITYPLTFWLTDIVSEIWGRRRADVMVWLGFGASLLMLAILQIAVALAPSDFWTLPARGLETSSEMQAAYAAVFHNPRLLVFASMLAYLVAQLFDVRLYHFWWRVSAGKHLWLRNNGSTMISQLVDTIIVNGIFLRWGFGMTWPQIGEVILWVYLVKMMMALLDTPLIYLGREVLHAFLDIPRGVVHRAAPLR